MEPNRRIHRLMAVPLHQLQHPKVLARHQLPTAQLPHTNPLIPASLEILLTSKDQRPTLGPLARLQDRVPIPQFLIPIEPRLPQTLHRALVIVRRYHLERSIRALEDGAATVLPLAALPLDAVLAAHVDGGGVPVVAPDHLVEAGGCFGWG
uniref:(northern house mosquito) hypothetical protein n=1 Tax=Culex pipiens TaxID=7175 RepID=A0A8D8HCN1_CULPI